MKMNLDNGFLLLYDWLPVLEDLSGESVKELLLALIEKQRNNAPMPQFSDPRCAIYYRIISPTIERRLAGQKGAQEAKKRAEKDTTPVPTPGTPSGTTVPSRAEQSKAEQSIAIAERSEEEESDAQACDAPAKDTSAPTPALSEEEKKKLVSFGIPENYVEQRLSRAASYAGEQGRPLSAVLLDWWEQDRTHRPTQGGKSSSRATLRAPSPPGEPAFDCCSFDTDDFFRAALEKSLRPPNDGARPATSKKNEKNSKNLLQEKG